MKLEIGTYEIADDCTIVYRDHKVTVKKKTRGMPDVMHCRDCIHQRFGRKTLKKQFYDSAYCELRPKNTDGLFYCAPGSRIACYRFKPKEKTDEV